MSTSNERGRRRTTTPKTKTKRNTKGTVTGVRTTSWRNKWCSSFSSSSSVALTKRQLFTTGQQWIAIGESGNCSALTMQARECSAAIDDNDDDGGDREQHRANCKLEATRESKKMTWLPAFQADGNQLEVIGSNQIRATEGKPGSSMISEDELEENKQDDEPQMSPSQIDSAKCRHYPKSRNHHHKQQQQQQQQQRRHHRSSPNYLVNCCEFSGRANGRSGGQKCQSSSPDRMPPKVSLESKACDCRKSVETGSKEASAHDEINQLKILDRRAKRARNKQNVARWSPAETPYMRARHGAVQESATNAAAQSGKCNGESCAWMSVRGKRRGRRRWLKISQLEPLNSEKRLQDDGDLATKHSTREILQEQSNQNPLFSSSLFKFETDHLRPARPSSRGGKFASTNRAILIAILIFIYIIVTSNSATHYKVAAISYWPLRKHGGNNQHRYQQATSDPSPKTGGPLLIGQQYKNFSSIVPYSIVQDSDYVGGDSGGQLSGLDSPLIEDQLIEEQQDSEQVAAGQNQGATRSDSYERDEPKSRALLPLDSNRLILPQMQQIKSRFNQGCVGGTKCQFFAFCWMSGGSLGASCGLLMTCCVTPSRQEIQPGFYGPVVNDPYCGRSTSKINRIVGGTDASFGQFPWQAFVQVGGSRCGGALISSRHVVTAGHCVARSQHSPSSIKVTLGDYILNSDIESIPHEVFSVVEVLLHPNFRFTPQADRYDVAVLELDRTASYKDNIKPICLPQKDAAFVGRVAYVAGWGALQAGSKLRPKVLQHVAVPVIENHVCESWHRRKGIDIRIYDEMMCAGYELGQRDACQGDSGGPLMLNQFGVWYLVGIVSAGYSCAKQYQPGIYHRVSSSSDWISSNVYQQGSR